MFRSRNVRSFDGIDVLLLSLICAGTVAIVVLFAGLLIFRS